MNRWRRRLVAAARAGALFPMAAWTGLVPVASGIAAGAVRLVTAGVKKVATELPQGARDRAVRREMAAGRGVAIA